MGKNVKDSVVITLLIFLLLIIVSLTFVFSIKAQDKREHLISVNPNYQYEYLYKETEDKSKSILLKYLKGRDICTYYKTNKTSALVVVYKDKEGVLYDNLKRIEYLERLENEINSLMPVNEECYSVDFSDAVYKNKIKHIPSKLTDFSGTKYKDYKDFKENAYLYLPIEIVGSTSKEVAKEITDKIKNNFKTINFKRGNVLVTFRETKDSEIYYRENFKIGG